jgi:outer membrane receptor protein involved in Fe transport
MKLNLKPVCAALFGTLYAGAFAQQPPDGSVKTLGTVDRWTHSSGARYSGKQYGTLDNSDPNGFTYTGFSSFFVTDVRPRYRIAKQWSAAVGIDNLNNARYWALHPYTQRTLVAELKFNM